MSLPGAAAMLFRAGFGFTGVCGPLINHKDKLENRKESIGECKSKKPMEMAPRNCRLLSLVMAQHVGSDQSHRFQTPQPTQPQTVAENTPFWKQNLFLYEFLGKCPQLGARNNYILLGQPAFRCTAGWPIPHRVNH